MKRLIVIATLFTFLLSACDSPVSNLTSDQQPSQTESSFSTIPPGTPPAQADSIRKSVWKKFTMRMERDSFGTVVIESMPVSGDRS